MTIIVRPPQLQELCAEIDAAGRFAIDLEFIPERTYTPELCLVQVSTDSGTHIIDPLALPDLGNLWQRIANPDILVVLHAAEQDLDLVYGLSGLVPQNIMDTQIAAGFAGYGYPIGYSKLLSHLLGVHISKTESFTDWTNRPLTESQIDYALDDVRHLLPIYDRLIERLSQSNRLTWVQEECKRYTAADRYKQDKTLDFLRIKGASALPSRGLAVLRELWHWRDQVAARINRPPRSILADNILLELARRPPRVAQDIQRIRGARPDQIRTFGEGIMEAIRRGTSIPDEECPLWPSFKSPPRRDIIVVDVLFAALKILCYELDLAPELVATRSDLETLVRLHREGKLASQKIPLMDGWRYPIAGEILVDLLEGSALKLKLHSGHPPVHIEIDNSTRSGQSRPGAST